MKVLRSGAVVAVALIAALTLSSCGKDSEETMDTAAVETTVGTIVDVASGAGNFSTLVAAVTAAELVETLSGEGPFTVFAPTDEAFAALPAGVLDALLLPENKALLAQILTYHVVSGKVMAADVTDGDVATVEGQTIALSTASGVTDNGANVVSGKVMAADVTDGDVPTVEGQTVKLSTMSGVTVNGATVIQADVEADNGVIHAIDAVILPPGVDVAALLNP
jgi:uncharacterized surface protein with fasciclin (FAS1) repeats